MSGATAWKPAAASAPSWWRQEYQVSGKPWHNSTKGPWPCSAILRRMPLVSIMRWVGSLTVFPFSAVWASALEPMTGKPNRKASGNTEAIKKLRRSVVASLPGTVLSMAEPPLHSGRDWYQQVPRLRNYGTEWYLVKGKSRETMATTSAAKRSAENADENPVRRRILDAAFSAFMEKG